MAGKQPESKPEAPNPKKLTPLPRQCPPVMRDGAEKMPVRWRGPV